MDEPTCKRVLEIALDAYEDAITALADANGALTNANQRFQTFLSKNPDVVSDLSQYKNAEQQFLGFSRQNLKDAQQAFEKRENFLQKLKEKENALHIQAQPQRIKQMRPFLNNLLPFSIPEDEFIITKYSENTYIPTPSLNQLFAQAGGFPSNYFIRQEELVLWDLVQELNEEYKRAIVIVGSPGVGKSTFLMMLAVYYAIVKNTNVMIVRKLYDYNETNGASAFIYLSSNGLYTKGKINVTNVFAIRRIYEDRKPLTFLDGFKDDEVNNGYLFSHLRPFDFLATSCQYDAKSNDPAITIVLPAWRLDSLKRYATLNPTWAIETGLRQKLRNHHENTLPSLVEQQYFYCGGSLREFCKQRRLLQIDCIKTIDTLESKQEFKMVHNYCGETTRKKVDHIRRHYVQDYKNKKHYWRTKFWKTSVDSAFIMQILSKFNSRDQMLEVYKYAETIGAGFLGTAFINLFHYTVRDIMKEDKVAVLKLPHNSEYSKICIDVGNVLCEGRTKQECHHFLRKKFNDSTYWYPNYHFITFVDSIAPCIVYPRKGEPILRLAYIHVTIASEKTFLPYRIEELDGLIQQNENLRKYESLYVVVTPNEHACGNFQFKENVPCNGAGIHYDTSHENADLDKMYSDDSSVENVNEMNISNSNISVKSDKWLQLVAYFDPKCEDEFTESKPRKRKKEMI